MKPRRRRSPVERPDATFDRGLQHERTELAWERTAISLVVAGMVLARYAAVESAWVLALVGLLQAAFGSALIVWSGFHYETLHGALRAGDDVVHPRAVHIVGRLTIAFTAAALLLGVLVAVR